MQTGFYWGLHEEDYFYYFKCKEFYVIMGQESINANDIKHMKETLDNQSLDIAALRDSTAVLITESQNTTKSVDRLVDKFDEHKEVCDNKQSENDQKIARLETNQKWLKCGVIGSVGAYFSLFLKKVLIVLGVM